MACGGSSGSGGDGRLPEEGRGSHPKNLQGVLKLAIENTSSNPDAAPREPLSEERKQWLRNALSEMYRDETKDMQQYLAILKDKRGSDSEEDVQVKENLLENIHDLCETMDNSRDFHKIGGLPTLLQYLHDSHSGVRWRTADLVATQAQNNPYCQQVFLEEQFLPELLEVLDKDENDMVRIKALYALSCIVRNHSSALDEFSKNDGFSVLIRTLQSNIEKLQIKTAFMLNAIILEREDVIDHLYQMGYTHQLVGLLQTPHNTSHEHITDVLNNLVSRHPGCLEECRQPALDLEQTLRLKIDSIHGKEEYLEELEYTKKLLTTCFADDDVDSQVPTDR